jgi:hypothetical protein
VSVGKDSSAATSVPKGAPIGVQDKQSLVAVIPGGLPKNLGDGGTWGEPCQLVSGEQGHRGTTSCMTDRRPG